MASAKLPNVPFPSILTRLRLLSFTYSSFPMECTPGRDPNFSVRAIDVTKSWCKVHGWPDYGILNFKISVLWMIILFASFTGFDRLDACNFGPKALVSATQLLRLLPLCDNLL